MFKFSKDGKSEYFLVIDKGEYFVSTVEPYDGEDFVSFIGKVVSDNMDEKLYKGVDSSNATGNVYEDIFIGDVYACYDTTKWVEVIEILG